MSCAALRIALILALAASARAAEECRVPDPPPIPDGATAADDSAEPNAPIEAMEGRHDAAIERMNEVAARFNAQLEIWNRRSD